MSSNVDDELNWLATQYVLGELSDVDRDGFEERLAGDLAACEAVAEASRMNLALHAAFATSTTASTTVVQNQRSLPAAIHQSWHAVGAAIVAVACLFLVMVLGWRSSNDPLHVQVASRSDHSAIELVSRWRTEMKFAEVDAEDAEDDWHESSADIAVPDWLLAGVSLEKRSVSLEKRGASLEKQGPVDDHPEELQDN